MPFPAVTFCNHNRVNCDALNDKMNNITVDDEYFNNLNLINEMACKRPAKRKKRQTVVANAGKENTRPVPEILNQEYNFLQLYMSMEEGDRAEIGHSFSGLIKSCLFRGRECDDIR